MHNQKKTSLFTNLFIYLINALLTAILGIAINKIFAMYVDPYEYGIYSIVSNLFNLCVSCVFMIFTNAILRYYGDYKAHCELEKLYASTIKLFFIIGILFILATGIILPILAQKIDDELYFSLILSFAILFLPDGLRQISVAFARCCGKAKRQTVASIVEHIVKLTVFVAVFFLIKQSATSIVYGTIAGTVVGVCFFLDCWLLPKQLWKIDTKETSINTLKFGLPLIGVPVVNYLLSTSDQLIISSICGETYAGLYSMGYKIATNMFSLVTAFLITSSHHKIMEINDTKSKEETENFVNRLALLFWIICIPMLFEIVAYNKYVLLILASEKYMDSAFVLSVSSIGIILCDYIKYTNKAWEISKKSWMISVFSGIGAATNVVLNFVFVPKFGYKAAAVTTIVSYFIVIVLSSQFGKKYLRVGIKIIDAIKLFFIGGMGFGTAYLLKLLFVHDIFTCVVAGLISLIIYLVLIVFVFKEKIKDTVLLFKSIGG